MWWFLAVNALAQDVVVPDPAPPPAGERATVSFESTKDGLVVGMITGRATGATGYGSVTVVGYQDLCTAPCSVEVPIGFQEFFGHENGLVAKTDKFELRPGTTTLRARPGSAALRAAGFYGGLVLVTAGASLISVGLANAPLSTTTFTTTTTCGTTSTTFSSSTYTCSTNFGTAPIADKGPSQTPFYIGGAVSAAFGLGGFVLAATQRGHWDVVSTP